MTQTLFGVTKAGGEQVFEYQISNDSGIRASIISYGAAVRQLWVPGTSGGPPVNVVLGFDTLPDYEVNANYLGVAVGRVCNRINGAKFNVAGHDYHVYKTHDRFCLHGGQCGISRKVWSLKHLSEQSVCLSYTSPDGEEGFPGEAEISVTYTTTNDRGLEIKFDAFCTKACPINLTNHSYFNLAGSQAPSSVHDHSIRIAADRTVVLDSDSIPTGEVGSLDQSDLDLRTLTKLSDRISKLGSPPHEGFDNYYVYQAVGYDREQAVARLGGIEMGVYTDQVGVQLYTSNYFQDFNIDGKVHQKHGAFCLETHGYPDAVNHSSFPSTIVQPGEAYLSLTKYVFRNI